MPIHLIWGDDVAASEREVAKLITKIIDPSWSSINLSRLDGANTEQASQALLEVRTPPFGNGGRLVILKRSPFCNNCSNELATSFEAVLDLIPQNTHLVLVNTNKPDGRLRTTKALIKLIKNKQGEEKSFLLPAIWDGAGQKNLVERTAKDLGLRLHPEATLLLIEALGNDSSRVHSELKKLALHAETNSSPSEEEQAKYLINVETVNALIEGKTTNALQIGDSLLAGKTIDAIARLNILFEAGEPPLRVLATLTGQVRGWLWVSLLEMEGEKDVSTIAKAAGIANPKRIYVMRKQLQKRQPQQFLELLSCLLEIEAALKRGVAPMDAFRDGLISKNHLK